MKKDSPDRGSHLLQSTVKKKKSILEKFPMPKEVCMYSILAFHNHPLAGTEQWEIYSLMEWIYKAVFRNKIGVSGDLQCSFTKVCWMMH